MSQAIKQSGAGAAGGSEAEAATSTSSSTRSNTLGILKYVNVLAFLLNVVVTYGIGTAGWFGLPTNSELSAKYQTLVTPIGYAFAIWGVIFVLQAIWSFQQLLDYWNVLSIIAIESINNIHYGYVFIVASQIAWTICFSQEFILGSLVAMVCIWWNLLQTVPSLPTDVSTSMVVNTIFQIWPFTIHFGWITAATIVNMNIVLVSYGLSTNIQYWSAVGGVVFLVLVGGIIMALRYGYIIPPLVLCWALWGVYAELTNNPQESITDAFTESQLSTLQGGVVGAIASIGLCLLWSLVVQRWFCRRRRNNNNEHSSTASSAAGAPYRRVQDGAGRL